MRDSFQFWHTHTITYNASNNKSPVSARNKRHNRCNIDIVLAALPCATQLGKLIFEHSLDKCRRGGDAASQPTRRQTQTHNSATDKSLQRTTRKEQQQPQGAQRRQQQQVGDSKKKKRALRRTPSQTQARKMNRRSYGATTIPTATLPTTTAAVAAAFAPVAALWRTATTATTTAQLSGAAPTAPTPTSSLQERRQLGALVSNGTTAGDADDLYLPASGNFSYFAPAISHVILAPTTAPSAATSLMTSLSVSDLQPAVIAHNVTASEAAAGGGSGVSAAAGGAGATGAAGDSLNSFYFYETEQFAVLWILFTVIVLGNSAVLFVMFINKNRKSRMNYFIKQLAIADLSVGLLHVLTDIVWRMTISWRAGNVACKVIRFSQVCVTYSSTYVLVAMSIDRYDAITHPMNFSKSWKRARHLVAAAWITSALFSLPILVLYEEKLIQGQMQCWIELGSPWAWQVYMCLVSASLFAFPALIISACYAIIVKTIWAKGSIFVPVERAGYGNAATRRASSRGIIPRAKVKTVKMTFVIVIVFILCWSPYIVFDLLQVFGQIPQTQTNIAIATFIQSLAPLNSAANPLIYCLFSSQVFRTLSRFPPFKWFSCCCRSYRNNSTQNRCNTVGRRLHHSCDSMRTLTTSLTVSRRSNKTAARVVICEHPKNALTMSEV